MRFEFRREFIDTWIPGRYLRRDPRNERLHRDPAFALPCKPDAHERIGYSDAMVATRKSLVQSRKVLTEADAMLAKDHKVLIERQHRKPRKPRKGWLR